jgi:hypothetical protein
MFDIAKVGSEFLVNTVTANNQTYADVALLPNGGFVVTWQDDAPRMAYWVAAP